MSVDVKTQSISGSVSHSEHLVLSDCFSVAEIIFISHSVQLLFVSERTQKDTVYFDGFLPSFFFLLTSLSCAAWTNVLCNFRQFSRGEINTRFRPRTKRERTKKEGLSRLCPRPHFGKECISVRLMVKRKCKCVRCYYAETGNVNAIGERSRGRWPLHGHPAPG